MHSARKLDDAHCIFQPHVGVLLMFLCSPRWDQTQRAYQTLMCLNCRLQTFRALGQCEEINTHRFL